MKRPRFLRPRPGAARHRATRSLGAILLVAGLASTGCSKTEAEAEDPKARAEEAASEGAETETGPDEATAAEPEGSESEAAEGEAGEAEGEAAEGEAGEADAAAAEAEAADGAAVVEGEAVPAGDGASAAAPTPTATKADVTYLLAIDHQVVELDPIARTSTPVHSLAEGIDIDSVARASDGSIVATTAGGDASQIHTWSADGEHHVWPEIPLEDGEYLSEAGTTTEGAAGVSIWKASENDESDASWIVGIALLDPATRSISRADAGVEDLELPLDACADPANAYAVVDPAADTFELTHRGEPFATLVNENFHDEVVIAAPCQGAGAIFEAYSAGTTGWSSELYLFAPDGSVSRELGVMEGDTDEGIHTSARPRWSPDKRFLVYPKRGVGWVFDPIDGEPWLLESVSRTRPWPVRNAS